MNVSEEELPGGALRVILDGRLDITGAAAVDLRMNVVSASHSAVVVDMTNVTFLGSMGLRSLVLPARAIKSRGGKMVLLGPNEMVLSVLKTSGIIVLIPVHHDLQSALSAVHK